MGSDGRALLAGTLAGGCEALATMPFEVTKNRIQMGHGPSGILANMVDTVRRVGPTGLYYGVQAQLLQTAVKGAIRFSAFERLKRILPPGSSFTAGLLAGVLEAVVWVAPTERLKILRQAEISHRATFGGGSSVIQATLGLVSKHGLSSLWVGSGTTMVRQGMANGMRFLMFDQFRATMPSWLPAPAAVSGVLTGVTSVWLTNPVDVLKTRVQACTGEGSQRLMSIALELLRKEGPSAFARGIGARSLKIGIGQGIIFGVYDELRKLMQ